ncbi:Rossmann-like alpha beta alpha sandwich fold [Chlorella sorokiniana]|uniref:Rossmann-like alpha beta alpha sandwich fold n=1 Tax=Chlorella sorokiniana TaxID=3076 RepID=A0A2P6TJ29_CHLSO|nr:Rossmann-like alpha beta alpha sandwich fold [Chlorella sorokiniana]|eukprot:PRW39255.1 Rossmann-like alpha beta alpha sandwich fold [Chlorella sorokiniana]
MMLGGGLLPGGGLPEWVVRRLEGCLHLYREQAAATARGLRDDAASVPAGAAVAGAAAEQQLEQEQRRRQRRPWAPERPSGACPIVLLGAGTPHKPPVIDEAGFVLHESTAYAAYLMRRGVPAGDLLKECQSYDTVGNGFFSLFMHALPANWRRIAVVTSDFHMPRTQATFDFIYGLAGQQLHGDPRWFKLEYRPVSDAGIFDADVLEARREKEAAAVATWQRNTAHIHTLADLHSWLFATHLCYSVSRQHEFGRERDLDPKLAATY